MATKSQSALKEFEQQLTCAVCLDIYSNPKILPCFHSFCHHCLEGLRVPVNPKRYSITCPTCRTSIELTGHVAFPIAFHLNNLKEVYNLMKQEKATNCSKHDDPLRFFCETCQEVICGTCAFSDHRNHDCTLIKDSYDKHCRKLEMSLNPVKEMMCDIDNILKMLTKRQNEVKKQGDLLKQEIHLVAKEIIEKIQQSEKQLTRNVETAIDCKLQVLSGQKKSAEMSLSRLNECKEFAEQSLRTGSHQEVLMGKKQMMERVSDVIKTINVEEYNPIEKADIQLIKNNKLELYDIGDIVYTTSLQQCRVRKISRHLITCKRERVSFPLSVSLELPNSYAVTVPLSSLCCSVISADNTPTNTTVTDTDHPGIYTCMIHCSPVMNGPHQVNVQFNNIQLESTSLVIPFNPYLAQNTSIRTIDGLKGPCGVAVNGDGHIFVVENSGHCISVLDREGKKVKSFTSTKFSHPHGVAITQCNDILVTDSNKIQKLTVDGKLIASISQRTCSSKLLEFNVPKGIDISPTTGHIYFIDCCNHRIQVLNPDLTFSHSFGREGSSEGQFNYPQFITVDNKGLVYVSDCGNHRIQVFTAEGKYKSQFGTFGSGPGELKYPTGLVIYNNLLYVVERDNHRVSVFTTDGKFVSSFEGYDKKFNYPLGITLDNEGYLYICDCGNNRLVMY